MKWFKKIYFFVIVAFLLSLVINCSKVTGGLDDQTPVLFINVELNNPASFTIDDTHKIYVIYYTDSAWAHPWLTYGVPGTTIINPAVGTFSTYLAVFWDANGNGVLDAGDPCTGYKNAKHPTIATADQLTNLIFLPLEWMMITITLVDTDVYGL